MQATNLSIMQQALNEDEYMQTLNCSLKLTSFIWTGKIKTFQLEHIFNPKNFW
jgi:hypothetical protein